jgi:hypothetical protein
VHKLTAEKTYKNKVTDGMMIPGGIASGYSPEWDEDGNPLIKSDDEKFIESKKKKKLGISSIDELPGMDPRGKQRSNKCKPNTLQNLGHLEQEAYGANYKGSKSTTQLDTIDEAINPGKILENNDSGSHVMDQGSRSNKKILISNKKSRTDIRLETSVSRSHRSRDTPMDCLPTELDHERFSSDGDRGHNEFDNRIKKGKTHLRHITGSQEPSVMPVPQIMNMHEAFLNSTAEKPKMTEANAWGIEANAAHIFANKKRTFMAKSIDINSSAIHASLSKPTTFGNPDFHDHMDSALRMVEDYFSRAKESLASRSGGLVPEPYWETLSFEELDKFSRTAKYFKSALEEKVIKLEFYINEVVKHVQQDILSSHRSLTEVDR